MVGTFEAELVMSVVYVLIDYLIFKRKISISSRNVERIIRFINKPIAHRGGIPENTIEAFKKSKSLGFSFVEADLQFTKDGSPILFHDYTVDRTSDKTGNIANITLSEALTLDVGSKFGYKGGAKIPCLAEAIAEIKKSDIFMFLEIKAITDNIVPFILEMFKNDKSLYGRIVIVSFFPDVLYKIGQHDSSINIGYYFRQRVFSIFPNGESRFDNWLLTIIAKRLDCLLYWIINKIVIPAITPPIILPDKEDILQKRFDVGECKRTGIPVITWTVNDSKEKLYFKETLQIPFMTDYVEGECDKTMYN